MNSNLERIKKLTEELEAPDFELSSFFELSLDLFAIARKDGFFKRVNPRWQEIFGWSENELLSRPWISFVHPEDREATRECAKKMTDGNVDVFFNRYLAKSGEYIQLAWRTTRWNDKGLAFCVAREAPCWAHDCPFK